jgi:hypothetical protein
VFAARSEAVVSLLGFEIKPEKIFQNLQITKRPVTKQPDLTSDEPKYLPTSSTEQSDNLELSQISDRITYWFLFKKVNVLEKKAQKAVNEGRDPKEYREYFKKKLNLTENQNSSLMQTAAACVTEIEASDARAKDIIKRGHQDLKRNPPRPGDPPPAPPIELTLLQNQRESVVIRYRDLLKTTLGDSKFVELDSYVKQEIATKITTNFKQTVRSPLPPVMFTSSAGRQQDQRNIELEKEGQ